MNITITRLAEEQARALIAWEYTGPYAIYNMAAEDDETSVDFFLDPANGYRAIVDEQENFLGFCNFGADAQVPGGDYSSAAIDIGMGMRPDLTGQGKGVLYAAAVFAFAEKEYPGMSQRVTIAEFNQRAQRLCQKIGFVPVGRFESRRNGRPFVIMVRQQQQEERRNTARP